ncbi:MAG: hypothetical protein ACYSUI_10320, partial [Planctomycetota bacterium]
MADDIGLDFSCTLFGEVPGKHAQLTPTLPFGVQVKSSFGRISLTRYVPLLTQSPLPFMLAIADIQRSQLTIYSGRYIRYALDLFGTQLRSFVGVPLNSSVGVDFAVRRAGSTARPRIQVDLPRLVSYGTRSQRVTLQGVQAALATEVLQVGLNDYSAAVNQYLFRFPKPRAATRVLAGSGSVLVFRRVMADRMTEYANNLWWLRTQRGESHQRETDAFFAAFRELKPYLPQPPHLKRALS